MAEQLDMRFQGMVPYLPMETAEDNPLAISRLISLNL
jgi:hypothetical protein